MDLERRNLHVHLDDRLCLEVQALRGRPRELRHLAVVRGVPSALALALLVLAAGDAVGQETDEKTGPVVTDATANPPRAREDVVVTATPVLEGVRVEPLAGTISTVGRRQIEDLNAQDIASALRRVPGLTISRYNPIGSYGGGDGGAVFVRGQGSGRPGAEISTTMDGIPKVVGVWTHPLLDLLSVDSVHRIDVYKGAQPVLFGNMAFSTVDLVPRRRTTEGLGAQVSAAYGSFDTSALSLLQEGRVDRFDWLVSASHRQSDGHRENASGRTRAVFARAGVRLAPGWDLSLLADLDDGRASDPGSVDAPRPGVTPRFASSDGLEILSLAHESGSGKGFLKLYHDDGSIDWRQWDADAGEAFSTLTDWRNYGVRARERVGAFGRGAITLGFDLDSYGGTSREEHPSGTVPLGDFRFRNTAVYAAYEHVLGGAVKLTPSAGVRYNDSRYFGSQWGAEAALLVAGAFGQAHARYAHAFNLPGVWVASFYQGYGRGDEWTSLEPERMDHLELGYSRTFGGKARVDVVAYRDDVGDALRFVPPPPPPPFFANAGSYRADGLEASLTLAPVAGLSLFAAFSGIRTEPADVPYAPGTSWSAGAVWARGRLRVSVDAQRQGRTWFGNPRFSAPPRPIAAFFLLNGRVGWRLGERTRGAEIYVAGENLTDSDYQYRPGYPMPGTSVMGGLSFGL
jgi:outer membrane cobalamin receptor